MVSIDQELHEKAKKKFINISELTEKALREKVKGSIDQSENEKECNYCQSKGDLLWLCPEECWICPKCLRGEIKRVEIGLIARR
jgi:hypothetical protein